MTCRMDENKQKEAGIGPFFKNSSNICKKVATTVLIRK